MRAEGAIKPAQAGLTGATLFWKVTARLSFQMAWPALPDARRTSPKVFRALCFSPNQFWFRSWRRLPK